MILVTGGAGFIGSVLLNELNNRLGRSDILLVDSMGTGEKWKNIANKQIADFIDKNTFYNLLANQSKDIPEFDAIFHLGACSSTTEDNIDYLLQNNFRFSKLLAELAISKNTPFIYASSAATYGDGSSGFDDDMSKLDTLVPLNGYALSKHLFDKWIITKKSKSQILGLKFFNVFGPNEYHKGSMVSVPYKAFFQLNEKKHMSLFKSEHPDYKDGEQKRDFIYVKDVVEIMLETYEKSVSGIYNLGTGKSKSWNELAKAAFSALNLEPDIRYIPLPEHLKGKYQYYTCANMESLHSKGITHQCLSLEDSMKDYYNNYLEKTSPYL